MRFEKENRIYVWMGLLLLFCGLVYLLADKYLIQVFLPRRDCFFHRFTGLYCPGCGGTRAVYAMLNGHFIQSLRYHLAVPFTAILYLYFMISNILHAVYPKIKAMPFREIYLWFVLFLVVVNFVLRNFLLLVFHIEL